MKISLVDYLTMIQELMPAVGFTKDQSSTCIAQLQQGRMTLDHLSANIAIQCFIRNHTSANADIVRMYLKEHQADKGVNFGDN